MSNDFIPAFTDPRPVLFVQNHNELFKHIKGLKKLYKRSIVIINWDGKYELPKFSIAFTKRKEYEWKKAFAPNAYIFGEN